MSSLDFITNRHSVRRFKEYQVPMEDILKVIEAATTAPSTKNQQNWHFVVIRNHETIAAIAKVVEERHIEIASQAATEKSKEYFMKFLKYYTAFQHAPTIILAYVGNAPLIEATILQEAGTGKEILEAIFAPCSGIQNVSAAMENLILAANSLGYGTCWMSGCCYAKKEIEAIVNLSKEGYELMALTPIGIPAHAPGIVPRKPIEEIMTVIE